MRDHNDDGEIALGVLTGCGFVAASIALYWILYLVI